MASSPSWDITQLKLVVTDVSGHPIGLIMKGQAVPEEYGEHLCKQLCRQRFGHSSWTASPLKMAATGYHETSVIN
jgi:hypothetical protein